MSKPPSTLALQLIQRMDAPGGAAGSKQQKKDEERRYRNRSCCTCFKDLTREQFCCCTRCKNFVQCFECAAYGYSKGQHIRTHPFIVCDPETSPMFVEDWTAEEEMLFMHAIQGCGYGNWREVSDNLGTKTPIECKVHYCGVFLDSESAPVPEIRVREPLELPPLPPFDTAPTLSCPSCGQKQNMVLMNKKEKNTPAEKIGYMPRRGEFDTEFNDDAEKIVCGMDFSEEDTQRDINEKIDRLLAYHSQVKARRKKRELVEQWDLLFTRMEDWQHPLGKGLRAEVELNDKILTFAPYIGRKDTELLAKRLHDLTRTIEKIEVRRNWQRNGVTTCDEGFLFKGLSALVRHDRIPEELFKDWNRCIKEYLSGHAKRDTEDAKLLSPKEMDLCRTEEIEPPVFTALKDLILREYVIRGGLSREEAIELCPERALQIDAMYELFLSVGWITE